MLIENDQQMLETSRYIHLNPIRAKMVKLPEEYQWSSYGEFIGIHKESKHLLFYKTNALIILLLSLYLY